jgi:hypothetical protein
MKDRGNVVGILLVYHRPLRVYPAGWHGNEKGQSGRSPQGRSADGLPLDRSPAGGPHSRRRISDCRAAPCPAAQDPPATRADHRPHCWVDRLNLSARIAVDAAAFLLPAMRPAPSPRTAHSGCGRTCTGPTPWSAPSSAVVRDDRGVPPRVPGIHTFGKGMATGVSGRGSMMIEMLLHP